ncbi:TonB-dependent receptor [Sphingobium sp. HBC34]|uniref:TonB-dependent receptor n=1 Tax=Sphingobium cyanobacteriorum TaxID=3063954 RepID=A0ABT8ZKF3_9SPHN|nr:TonB-dependent receptor [Sphingobium sp. HBC34]MDO7835003.1 TonB-dependent receptor [Sphingobium sp. HBC34]
MNTVYRQAVGVSLLSIAIAGLPHHAVAQDNLRPGEAQANSAARAQNGFDDIIVTARKVGEASQSLPITISAFNAEQIREKVILDVRDLQTVTPGLTISNNQTGGTPVFAIRGTTTELGIDGGVALYLNDVPLMNAIGLSTQFYDISTVEVLKGPQGTQFGTNTTGGTLTVRTNLPSPAFEGYVKAGYGNYSRKELEGMINLPVNDVLGFRFAGNWIKRDGYVRNPIAAGGAPDRFANENRYSLRGTMQLGSGPVDSVLIVDYFNRDEAPSGTIPTDFGPAAGSGINPGDLGERIGNRKTIYVGADASGVQREYYGKAKLFGIEHRLNIDLTDTLKLRNVLGWRKDMLGFSEDTSGLTLTQVNIYKDVEASQWIDDITLMYSAMDDRWRTSVGGFFLSSDKREGINANVGQSLFLSGAFGFSLPLVIDIHNFEWKKFSSSAVYANSELEVTPTLSVGGGFRYNWDKISSRVSASQAVGVLPTFGANYFPDAQTPCATAALIFYQARDFAACTGQRSRRFRAPSWNLSVTNKFGAHVLGYAKISHGYLSGGSNFTIREVPFFEPETTTMMEAGLKADWFLAGRPLRTNVAVYRGKTKDKQVFVNANYDDQFAGYGVINAARQSVWGVDLELRYSPFQGLTLDASYNFIKSKFDEFIIPGLGGNADGQTGVTLVQPTDLSGATPAQTPKHQFNVAASYEWPVASTIGQITTTVSGYHTSKITQTNVFGDYNASFGKRFNEIAGYFTANASLNWDNVMNGPINIQLWARNLFDKEYITSRNVQFQAWGYSTATFGAPRTYGVSANYRF